MVSDRTEIKNAIIADLKTITKANDFNTEVMRVFKGYKSMEQLSPTDFPAFGLADINTVARLTGDGVYEYEWILAIIPYVTANKDTEGDYLLMTALEEMFEDVITLYEQEGTNLSSVESVECLEILTYTPDPFNTDTKASGYITIKVTYT